MQENKNSNSAWVAAVSMGLGHQRTAFPLRHLSLDGKFISANDYDGMPFGDRRIWEVNRRFYEFISRFKRTPLIGSSFFSVFDQFQKISTFYPKKDLSEPNFGVKRIFNLLNKGWGRDLMEKLRKNPLPFISTFSTPAFMAEFFGYPGDIYCVVTDADISRAWASLNPRSSRIRYCAPTSRVAERLELYGVKKENVFLTGYPLPKENIGSEKGEICKNDAGFRLLNLDPKGRYREKYQGLVKEYIGELPQNSNRILTLMFSIGGAGAQKEIAAAILRSLKNKILNREIKVIVSAGIKEKVRDYFLGCGAEIIWSDNLYDYFARFNQALRKTDILWTKPSELSFYCALGIPIIIAPPIGSQEDFNQEWLLKLGAGILQENPLHTDEWLFDFLKQGYFAEAAMQGFVEAEKMGTFTIEKVIRQGVQSF